MNTPSIAVLDCHKNCTAESQKIVDAFKNAGCEKTALFEARKLQFPQGFDAIAISGAGRSAANHFWLRKTRDFIEERIQQGTPVLGICFGSQLLGEIFGNKIVALKAPEVGWTNISLTESGKKDPLFAGLPPTFPVFEHHIRSVEMSITNKNVLAANAACVQAVRYSPRIYGTQFHPEETPELGTAFLQKDPRCKDFEAATALRPANYIQGRIFRNFANMIKDLNTRPVL